MVSSSLSLRILGLTVLLCFTSMVSSHSQMRCAKYNTQTGACSAPIRNAAVSFGEEAYRGERGLCQSPWTNPISASYANGAGCPDWAPCPDAMGTFTKGEKFTVMWFARNHAVADQSPDTVFLYLSPVESANQGADTSAAVFTQNLLCSGPYANCGGQNGDTVKCTLNCTMPTNLANGIYTLWWKWPWQGTTYSTCADINVSGGSSSSSAPVPVPTPTPSTPSTTGRRQTVAVTTGRVQTPATTGRRASTTTTSSTSSSSTSTSTSSSTVPSSSECTLGHMRCVSESQFSSCYQLSSTVNGWSQPRSCQAGLKCSPSGNFVYCT